MVLPVLLGRHAGSFGSDHLVATRLGKEGAHFGTKTIAAVKPCGGHSSPWEANMPPTASLAPESTPRVALVKMKVGPGTNPDFYFDSGQLEIPTGLA